MSGPANTQFAIATHMLTLLAAGPEELKTSEAMAQSANANPVHIRRVLGRLRAAGLVTSRPGPGGGWSLVADPTTTTLANVWAAIHCGDGVLGVHEAAPDCVAGQGIQRTLEAIDRRAVAAIEAELATTTIGDLVAEAAVPLGA
jgi:Rrf2 family protein